MARALLDTALAITGRYLAWHGEHLTRCRVIQCVCGSVALFLALAWVLRGGLLWWLPPHL